MCLAGRKPLVLKDEIYAVWGMLAGALVGLGWTQGAWQISCPFCTYRDFENVIGVLQMEAA